MCEFWNLWYNTVSQQLSEDATCDIMFDFSYSEDFNKLYWNSAGPQYLMIQQLVDFFYIVGAPEEEIEKLNVVGESINPGLLIVFVRFCFEMLLFTLLVRSYWIMD